MPYDRNEMSRLDRVSAGIASRSTEEQARIRRPARGQGSYETANHQAGEGPC